MAGSHRVLSGKGTSQEEHGMDTKKNSNRLVAAAAGLFLANVLITGAANGQLQVITVPANSMDLESLNYQQLGQQLLVVE